MDKYLKKFKATNYGHCIVKEELIISDDEESNEVDVETVGESIDESFLETSFEHNESNGTVKGPIKRKRSRYFRNKNDNTCNDKQSTLDLFLKTKNLESNDQFENPKNVTNDEKPKATEIAATSDNIDTLYKKFGKSHCHKCNIKRAVIRQKARCPKCKTKLTYSCETCNKTYGDFTELGYHLKRQHTSQIHSCSICNKTFAYRRGMLEHRRIQHGFVNEKGVIVQQSAKCGKKFRLNHMKKHEKVCGEEATFKCDKCPYVAFYKSNLTNHVIEKHTEFLKICENCDKIFTNPRSMRRHLKVYCKKVKRIECHHCGHKFYRRDQVLNHLDQVHFRGSLTGNPVDDSQMTRICKYCDKTLDLYEQMRKHLERCEFAPLSFRRLPVDGNNKSIRTCEFCGLRLKRYDHMKYHLQRCESAPLNIRRQCLSDDGRTCRYCGLKLKRYEHMRYHLDRCESAPPECRLENENADQPDLDTACKNLSKTYCENCKTKRPLKQRQLRCKKCEASLKFICERCPKSFKCTKLLLNHLRVKHVKNKTFLRCDKCHSSYSHLKDLKFHKKIHHPSEPTTKMYTCSKCGKKYHNVASLRKHRVSCVEEPKFHCDKCPYKTHFKSSLVDHFRAKKSTCF